MHALERTRRPGARALVGLLLTLAFGTVLAASPVEITFTYGSEKQSWVEEVTRDFHASEPRTASGRPIRVTAVPMGSGEIVREVLQGSRRPHLVSPASGAFVELGNAESRERSARPLVGPTRDLVLSPVVIAMWEPMARALGWPDRPVGWREVLALAESPDGWAKAGHPEWGRFRFGHTHPEHSNSGLLSLLAEVYAATGKTRGLTLADVEAPETLAFVRGIEASVVHYGRSTGFFGQQMFRHGPGYLSAAVLYESMVAEANAKGGLPQPIVAVYPREGTFWSDHPVGVVDRDWVGPEERDAAERYIAFLLARPQQEKALKHGFRPADVDVPLGSTFARPGLDPGEPKTTLRVPEAKVLAAVLQLWTRAKKRADVALVLDISGSMQGEKLAKAQAGARQLAAMLGEGDRLSLLVFSDRLHWMLEDLAMPAGLPRVERVLGGLQAAGGTAVYDAVAAAYGRLQERAPAGVNTAVVALTDGQDNRSRQALDALVASLAASGPREVRVFAIGYGKDASLPAMQRIAEATRARAYEGDPVTIEKVFFDLATFF